MIDELLRHIEEIGIEIKYSQLMQFDIHLEKDLIMNVKQEDDEYVAALFCHLHPNDSFKSSLKWPSKSSSPPFSCLLHIDDNITYLPIEEMLKCVKKILDR